MEYDAKYPIILLENCKFTELVVKHYHRLLLHNDMREVDCFAVTTVNFINDFVFIFCNYPIFWFIMEFMESAFSIESGSYFVRFEYLP